MSECTQFEDITCADYYSCCDCGQRDTEIQSCMRCFSCNACDECYGEDEE